MRTAPQTSALAESAARLATLVPRSRLDPAVLAWADGPGRNRKWAVAFSGGADSFALLLLLWAHWPGKRRTLSALHFDHRLRGAESRADARFCRRMCAALRVPFIVGRWEGAHGSAGEAQARAARMAFFATHARVVWLGHQQDDIAESMLMRLARGSGTGGLAAPRPVQPMPGGRVHLRPLLTLKKADIVAALSAAGIAWREDSSNAGPLFFRNRIRSRVIPAWQEAAQRDALAGASRSRALLEEDDAALEGWVDDMALLDTDDGLMLSRLAGKPAALWRRALHRWLLAQPRAGELSRQAFDALLAAIRCGAPTRHSLGREGFAVVRKGVLAFARNRKRTS
ncbi:MAG: tRNA lysidine(34) synthetase TilS [Opitutaceae bacterium]|nr:tRNA lysidine(34) synthetase TilS [Opitutaceae bacterium]